MDLRSYYRLSRSPRYSVLFAVPLLLAYEALAWLLSDSGTGIRNGADVLLKSLFLTIGGGRGLLVFNLLLLGVGAWLVVSDWRRNRGPLKRSVFAGMFLESIVLGVLVGVVVGRVTSALLQYLSLTQMSQLGLGNQIMLSLGAGIYEELLFRVLIVGAIAAIATRVLHWSPRQSGVVACLLGALLFSAFHYIGPYGDPLQLQSFVFRALAGLVFSAIYLTRGFGVAAWTHALYDVFVSLL